MRLKRCRKCNEEKPLSSFSHQRNAPDKHQYHCKSCVSQWQIAFKAARSEPVRLAIMQVMQAENRPMTAAEIAAKLPMDLSNNAVGVFMIPLVKQGYLSIVRRKGYHGIYSATSKLIPGVGMTEIRSDLKRIVITEEDENWMQYYQTRAALRKNRGECRV